VLLRVRRAAGARWSASAQVDEVEVVAGVGPVVAGVGAARLAGAVVEEEGAARQLSRR
jgi:hypothetical protein